MSDDIVKRLNNLDGNEIQWSNVWEIAEDAAGEITRLRAENERLRLENDKLREALKPLAAMDVELLDENKKPTGIHAFDTWDQNQVVFDIGKDRKIVVADLRRARNAIEGVTKKEGAGNE